MAFRARRRAARQGKAAQRAIEGIWVNLEHLAASAPAAVSAVRSAASSRPAGSHSVSPSTWAPDRAKATRCTEAGAMRREWRR